MTSRRPAAEAPKALWRDWAKELRGQFPTAELSRRVVNEVRRSPTYRSAAHVLIYFAFGSEIDLRALMDDPKHFYATRTWPSFDRGLTIHRADAGLETHRFGYLQPIASAARVPANEIDLALVPGLCFDRSGARLGYGRGYYDRLLAAFPPDVPRVGVTVSDLVVDELPTTERDVRVTHLATERGVEALRA